MHTNPGIRQPDPTSASARGEKEAQLKAGDSEEQAEQDALLAARYRELFGVDPVPGAVIAMRTSKQPIDARAERIYMLTTLCYWILDTAWREGTLGKPFGAPDNAAGLTVGSRKSTVEGETGVTRVTGETQVSEDQEVGREVPLSHQQVDGRT